MLGSVTTMEASLPLLAANYDVFVLWPDAVEFYKGQSSQKHFFLLLHVPHCLGEPLISAKSVFILFLVSARPNTQSVLCVMEYRWVQL